MELLHRFIEYIRQQGLFAVKDKLLLAVSGGVDSVVLCDLCKKAGFDFSIAHCNFKLRGEASDADENFVKELATKYGVPFYVNHFDTNAIASERKTSIEETARDLRYNWFYELLDKNDSPIPESDRPKWIVTGHHANDNIETVVMNFFRGTGIKGLHGILPVNNKLIRPLLFAKRQEIEAYAMEEGLKHISDTTNFENTFTRNFFRNQLLPEVAGFFPETEKNILNNIERFREAEELYGQAIESHKRKLCRKKGKEIHIPVLQLKKTKPLLTIVYEIIKEFGFSAHQTPEVIALFDSETGKYISSSSHRIIKHRHCLIIAPVIASEASNVIIESTDKEIQFALGKLNIEETSNLKPQTLNNIAILDSKNISFPLLLRKWKTGDYFYPLGMKKKKKIARFLIDQKLSKTEKENAWVIESEQRIIWVVGHRIDDRFKITDNTNALLRLTLTPQ